MSRKAHEKKSQLVKALRGYSPEEVIQGILIDVTVNKNNSNQKIETYWFNNYGWNVIVDIETDRLITAYPNRKVKLRGKE